MRSLRGIATLFRDATAVVAFVAIWQLVTVLLAVPVFLLPQPVVIAQAFATNLDAIGLALAQTTAEAAVGFVGGNVLGLVLAFVFVRSSLISRAGLPLAIGRTVRLR